MSEIQGVGKPTQKRKNHYQLNMSLTKTLKDEMIRRAVKQGKSLSALAKEYLLEGMKAEDMRKARQGGNISW